MQARSSSLVASRTSGRAAFTLVEMIVVLTVLGIVGTMAIPRIDFDRYRTDAAARIARGALQGAQRSAILRQTNVIVALDVSRQLLTVIEDVNNNDQLDPGERAVSRGLSDGARFVAPTVALQGCGTGAVNGGNLLRIGGAPAVSFLRDGASNSDLCLYINAGHGAAKTMRAIRLTQATGRTELWGYDGTHWKEVGP